MQLPKGIQQAELYIKPPTGTHKGFSVVARWGRGSLSQRTETLKLPEIKNTSRLYKEGKLSYEDAHKALTHLISQITEGKAKKKKEPKYSQANKRILDRYFKKVYGPRDTKNPRNAYCRLIRVLKVIGKIPLSTGSDMEFYQAIKDATDDPATRKRLNSSLRQLLKFIGRTDFQVLRIKKTRRKIRYLTLEEFREVAKVIVDQKFALLCWSIFATGCRPGEVFALEPRSYSDKDNVVFVESSIDGETLDEEPTKTEEARHTVVIKECIPYLKAWLELPRKEKLSIRRLRHAEMFSKAVSTAFPEKGRIVLYDLRHSFAIWWLNAGASTKLVAQSLGNSQIVCEQHYQGHYLTQGGVETMNRLQFK